MGSSTTTTKGARRSTKESGTHAIRECVEASNGQRAAIYLRRSAMDERGDNTSITYQREACERIASQHGLEIVAEFNEGAGRSASHFAETIRPEYDKALAGLGSDFTTIIAYAVDRLTRQGMGAVGHLLDHASAGGGRIITNDGLDTANESSRMVASFMSEQARMEMTKLSERICAAKEQHRREGRYLGGSVSYGLMPVRSLDEPTYMVVDPTAAAVIVEMVDRLLAGATLNETCHWANGLGHRTSHGAKWGPTTLSRLVRSPHLVGHRKQGNSLYTDESGQPVVVTEPIISEAQFSRIDRVLKSRRRSPSDPNKPTKARPPTPVSLLGGLINCGDCGEPLYLTNYLNKKGRDYGYYGCRSCRPMVSVRSDLVMAHVARSALLFVASLKPDSPIMAEVSQRMLATFSPEQVNRRGEIVDEVETLDGRMRKFRQENLTGVLGDDEYYNLSENATMRRNDLVDEMATLPEVKPDLGILLDICQASDNPDDLVGEGSAWAALEHHRRRSILRVLVDQVTVERRAKPSEDIEGRTVIEFCREDNVIQLAQRPDKIRRFSAAAKVAV